MTHLMAPSFDPPAQHWRDDHDDAALVRRVAMGDVPAQERLDMRMRATTERWLAADGSGRERGTEEPLFTARGDTYFVPAETCASLASRNRVPVMGGTLGQLATLPVGATAPACWSATSAPTEFVDVVGEVVATPPAGADVMIRSQSLFASFGDTELHFGELVRESDAGSAVPPGLTGPTAEEPDPDPTPMLLPTATTWVEVRATPKVVFDTGVVDELHVLPILGPMQWQEAIGMDAIATLPSTPAAMLQLLHTASAAARAKVAAAGVMHPVVAADSDDEAAVSLAVQLLTEAPMSPAARRATFDALAELAAAGDARLTRGAELGDDTPTVRIEFARPNPEGYEDPTGFVPRYAIVLDARDAQLAATEFTYGKRQSYVTRWKSPKRTTSLDA